MTITIEDIIAECKNCGKGAKGVDRIMQLFTFKKLNWSRPERSIVTDWCRECISKGGYKDYLRDKRRTETKHYLMAHEEEIEIMMNRLIENGTLKSVTTIIERKTITKKKTIKIDLLEGLTESQQVIVKSLVKKGYSPMGFSVDVENDIIKYMGKQVI